MSRKIVRDCGNQFLPDGRSTGRSPHASHHNNPEKTNLSPQEKGGDESHPTLQQTAGWFTMMAGPSPNDTRSAHLSKWNGKSMATGLLLIGHGTRHAGGQREFGQLVNMVAGRLPKVMVEPGCLEHAAPRIEQGFQRLVERGAQQIVACPLLLFAAGHAKQDIPRVLEEQSARHPQVAIRLAPPLGCHEALLQLSVERYREALPERQAPRTLLLLIGRGSSDDGARQQMEQFVRRREALTPEVDIQMAFLARAEPGIDSAFAEAAESDYATVVVQPHLLFDGELIGRLKQQVAGRQTSDRQSWLMAGHLGASRELLPVLIDRFNGSCLEIGA